jgi:hypothetical protein
MSPESHLEIGLAALSEGQRAIAHLVVVLGLLAAVALVYLIRRMRRPDQTPKRHQIPEEKS